jgi:hypothetical protein
MNPLHKFEPDFPKIHSNIALPSTPRSSEWSLPFRFSDQSFVQVLGDVACGFVDRLFFFFFTLLNNVSWFRKSETFWFQCWLLPILGSRVCQNGTLFTRVRCQFLIRVRVQIK